MSDGVTKAGGKLEREIWGEGEKPAHQRDRGNMPEAMGKQERKREEE